jgi:hypothetical protein
MENTEHLLLNRPSLNKSFRSPEGIHGEELFTKIRKVSEGGNVSTLVSSAKANDERACKDKHAAYVKEVESRTVDGGVFTVYFSTEKMCDTMITWLPREVNEPRHVFKTL